MISEHLNPHLHNPHLDGSPVDFKGGKTGVLLLHGLTATPVEVRHLAEYLHQQGLTLAAPLLPGHGTRPEDLNHTRWQEWIDTAEQSYAKLKQQCTTIFVGGESTGAVIALYLAALHPEISGILAYAPAIKLRLSCPKRLGIKLFAGWLQDFQKKGLDEDTTWQGYRIHPLKGVKQLLALQTATRKQLKKIHQPVLIFTGGQDNTIDQTSAEMVQEGVSSPVKLAYFFENSPHCILLGQDFDAVAEISWQFIQDLAATPT